MRMHTCGRVTLLLGDPSAIQLDAAKEITGDFVIRIVRYGEDNRRIHIHRRVVS